MVIMFYGVSYFRCRRTGAENRKFFTHVPLFNFKNPLLTGDFLNFSTIFGAENKGHGMLDGNDNLTIGLSLSIMSTGVTVLQSP